MTESSSRLEGLDILKAIAVLWIVCFHVYISVYASHFVTPLTIGGHEPGSLAQMVSWSHGSIAAWLHAVLHPLLLMGYQGVHILFAASGFGLVLSAERRGGLGTLGSWLLSHLARLLPLYWLAHVVFWIACFVAGDFRAMPLDRRAIASLLAVNWVYPPWQWYGPDAWWFVRTLVQFYLVFPALYAAMRRLGPLKFLLAAAVATMLIRGLCLWVLRPIHPAVLNFGFAGCRLLEFALGMAAGLAVARGDTKFLTRWRYIPLYFTAWVLGMGAAFSLPGKIVSEGLIGMGVSGLGGFAAIRLARFRYSWTLGWVGRHSYGLYLLHGPVIRPAIAAIALITSNQIVGVVAAPLLVCLPGLALDRLAGRLQHVARSFLTGGSPRKQHARVSADNCRE